MHRFLLTAGSLFCLVVTAAAQDSGGPVKVRFLAERAPDAIGQVLMASEEVRSKPFDLPVNNLTDPMEAPARAFTLRTAEKDLALTKITLPEPAKSFIVILIPSAEAGYNPVVIADSDPSFRPGDVYLYNHSDKPVLGYVGTSKFILAPKKGQPLRPAGAKENTYYDVRFGVREKEGDRPLSSTRWPVDNMMRSYVFFFVSPRTGRIDFRAVDEFITAEKRDG